MFVLVIRVRWRGAVCYKSQSTDYSTTSANMFKKCYICILVYEKKGFGGWCQKYRQGFLVNKLWSCFVLFNSCFVFD